MAYAVFRRADASYWQFVAGGGDPRKPRSFPPGQIVNTEHHLPLFVIMMTARFSNPAAHQYSAGHHLHCVFPVQIQRRTRGEPRRSITMSRADGMLSCRQKTIRRRPSARILPCSGSSRTLRGRKTAGNAVDSVQFEDYRTTLESRRPNGKSRFSLTLRRAVFTLLVAFSKVQTQIEEEGKLRVRFTARERVRGASCLTKLWGLERRPGAS